MRSIATSSPLAGFALSLLLTNLPNVIQPVHASKLKVDAPDEELTTDVYGGKGAGILKHPADWSRNVQTIAAHSHNDYWRDTPVLEALALGVTSVESDVWLNPDDGILYVGYDPFSLSRERTFASLTVAPLLKAIGQANEANHLYSDSPEANFFKNLQRQVSEEAVASAAASTAPGSAATLPPSWNGFWSAGSGMTTPITVLVDIKTEGNATWDALVKELKPLREKGYLTRYENGKLLPGPVTIVGTGNTPIGKVAPLLERDYFLDCPLGKLDAPAIINGTSYDYNSTLCGVASTNLASLTPEYKGLTEPTDAQRANLTKAIDDAHARGIKTRVWETPFWPVYSRDNVNRLLIELGSDYINADDLETLIKF